MELRVDVEPDCEGTTGTAWYFTLPCVSCQGCQEYQCLDNSKAHCGSNGYLIDFGLYYCNRYYGKCYSEIHNANRCDSLDYYNKFDIDGQGFINCARVELLDYLESYLNVRSFFSQTYPSAKFTGIKWKSWLRRFGNRRIW